MPVRIFCYYAQEDEALLNRLKVHLSPLHRQGLTKLWHDRNISKREIEINARLNEAQLILLLISPDFMSSDYCYGVEMKRALERHERGEAYVLPVILRPTYWQGVFGELQTLPKDGLPVTDLGWQSIDQALYRVTEGISKVIENLTAQSSIELVVQEDDATLLDADALALKYAQEFFGLDKTVAYLLDKRGIAAETLRPRIGDYRYVETKSCIRAHNALFIGVPDLIDFSYHNIQEFAMLVLNVLAKVAPSTKHLAMTIHGVNYGLDEIEAFLAQFDGYLQALQSRGFPRDLEKITIVDYNSKRVQRLQRAFEEKFAGTSLISQANGRLVYNLPKRRHDLNFQNDQQPVLTNKKVEIVSDVKPHAFVAMPFKEDMYDVFYYGIQQPVRAAGFICERVDQEASIGDILDQVKKKIETAAVVIADLTGANPNVYLEVGYAWGKGRSTLLLVRDEQELRFDVRGQRCLKYKRIKDLEGALTKELKELQSKGVI